MVLYKYQALSDAGKRMSGVINADSLDAAKEFLHAEELMVIDVQIYQEKKKNIKLSPSTLLDFTRMLGQLLKSGIPLYESLVIIEEKYRQNRFHPLFVDLCDELKTGSPLSQAFAKYPQNFDPIYIAMIKAGEQTAALARVFDELCQQLQRQQKLKKQLVSAAAYPLFLAGFCVVVFLSLLLFVIPSMKSLFEGRSLHPITQIVFAASDIAIHYGAWIGLTILFVATGFMTLLQRSTSREKIDSLLLRTPILNHFIREAATVRFCRTASLLLSGGIPILQTLNLSRSVMKNRLLENVIADAEQKVSEGKTLSGELAQSPLIPTIVPRMLSIAEETGKTAFMLQSIANICEENLEKKLQQAVAFLQPALLLTLGLIVGIVLLSILIPLTDVGSML
jgi:general secretion pathway protein F/type IV pilus assembly protein PilC